MRFRIGKVHVLTESSLSDLLEEAWEGGHTEAHMEEELRRRLLMEVAKRMRQSREDGYIPVAPAPEAGLPN